MIDNKEYESKRISKSRRGVDEEIQPNGEGVLRGGIWSESIDSMGQKYPNFDFGKIQGSDEYANISIPRKSKESEIRV